MNIKPAIDRIYRVVPGCEIRKGAGLGSALVNQQKPEKVNEMSTPKPEQKSRRELEIARELARLLNVMPFEFMLDLQSKLLALQDEPLEQDLAIEREQQLVRKSLGKNVSKPETNDQRRLDIVVPLAPLGMDENEQALVYREIVLELKLYQENLVQVNDYAKVRKDALVVSIYQTPAPLPPPIKLNNVVQLTWTDLFWGLFPLLDLNAQRRVIGADTSAIQLGILKVDYRKALGSVADRYLEDFLLDIKPLAKTNFHRVIVVTGEKARDAALRGIHFCPTSWDMDFDYLCVVYQKKLQYVGQVVNRAYPVEYERTSAPNGAPKYSVKNLSSFENIVQALFQDPKGSFQNHVNVYDHGDEGAVTWLQNQAEVEKPSFPPIGQIFQRKGALTQSHRYFESPEAFTAFFLATPPTTT